MLHSLHLNDKQYVPWALFVLTTLFGVIYWHLYSESVPALHIFYSFLSFKHFNVFSLEYFNFLTYKPNGYPVFLFLIRNIAQENVALVINTVISFQLVLFLSSAWYLSLRFYYLSNRRFFGFLLLILIIGNPEIVKFCFLIMTESFMMSLLMLILGLSCQWASQKNFSKRQRTLVLLSTCLGAAILFRPICYAWIIAMAFVLIIVYSQAFFTWIELVKALGIFCIPLLLCWTLGAFFHYYIFGTFQNQAVLNEFMLGKVAITLKPQDLKNPTPPVKNVLNLLQPIHKLMNQAKTSKIKYWLHLIYSDAGIINQHHISPQNLSNLQEIRRQSRQAFLDMWIHHPMKYIKNVAMHYIALWQFWDLMTPKDIQAFLQFSKTNGPLPYAPLQQGELPPTLLPDGLPPLSDIYPLDTLAPIAALRLHLNDYTTWPSFLFFIRTVMGIIWVITLCFFGLGLLCLRNQQWSTPPVWAGLCGAALLQATYLITASIQVGAFRYGIVMWPAVVFVGVTFPLLFLAPPKTQTVSKRIDG